MTISAKGGECMSGLCWEAQNMNKILVKEIYSFMKRSCRMQPVANFSSCSLHGELTRVFGYHARDKLIRAICVLAMLLLENYPDKLGCGKIKRGLLV